MQAPAHCRRGVRFGGNQGGLWISGCVENVPATSPTRVCSAGVAARSPRAICSCFPCSLAPCARSLAPLFSAINSHSYWLGNRKRCTGRTHRAGRREAAGRGQQARGTLRPAPPHRRSRHGAVPYSSRLTPALGLIFRSACSSPRGSLFEPRAAPSIRCTCNIERTPVMQRAPTTQRAPG